MLLLFSLLYWSLLLLMAGAAGLLIWGWRARKLDDHPICRRCRYDLFGLPQPLSACPECGADVSRPGATYIGHRTRHKPAIRMALLCIVLFGAGVYFANWRHEEIRSRPGQFHEALINGDLAQIDRLLALHPEFATGYGARLTFESMEVAFVFGASDVVVQRLLAAGADPNERARMGLTPLQWAIVRQRQSTAELLINAGADVNLASGGKSPLHTVAADSPTWRRIESGPMIELLVNAGAEVNAVDQRQRTALHLAAIGGHLSAVQALLAAGADVHARDDEGCTPLHAAISPPHPAAPNSHRVMRFTMLQLLLDHGADVNARNRQGKTALDRLDEMNIQEQAWIDLLESRGGKRGRELDATP